MPDNFDREELVRQKIQAEEEAEQIATKDAQELVLDFLKEKKGYMDEDIEIDRRFTVKTAGHQEEVSVDYIIKLKDKRYMAIKCSMALESRERHIIAFSRVADSSQIPYSVITDGIHAYLIDTASGRRLSEKLDGIPSRDEAMKEIDEIELKVHPPEKAEKEKQILLAFECASCPRGTT